MRDRLLFQSFCVFFKNLSKLLSGASAARFFSAPSRLVPDSAVTTVSCLSLPNAKVNRVVPATFFVSVPTCMLMLSHCIVSMGCEKRVRKYTCCLRAQPLE